MRNFILAGTCALSLALAACSGGALNTGSSVASGASSPVTASLLTVIENLTPSVSNAVQKVNAGIAATAADKVAVCDAINWLPDIAMGVNTIAKIDATGQQIEGKTITGLQTACANPTSDVNSLVKTAGLTFLAATQPAS